MTSAIRFRVAAGFGMALLSLMLVMFVFGGVAFPAQIGKRLRATIFPPHRQSIEHNCRERAGHIGLKKDIARSDGKGAFALVRSKCCSESQRVEMAAMIRC